MKTLKRHNGRLILHYVITFGLLVNRFVIKRITPAYFEKSRREQQKLVWPYAVLDVIADSGSTQVEAAIRIPIVTKQ